jgi:hypothetical protein
MVNKHIMYMFKIFENPSFRTINFIKINIEGDSRVIMTPTELKMQPTIHLGSKSGYLLRPNPALRSKCIVGCIFNFVGLIITRESPWIIIKQ